MFSTLLFILLAPPAALAVAYFLIPRPLFAAIDRRIDKAIDAVNFNQHKSAYSHIGFRPIHEEFRDVELEVRGEIPADLEGVYLRNGTNLQFDQTRSRYHMFNGAGMLHQVQIKDGKAWYDNTYVRTPRFDVEDLHHHRPVDRDRDLVTLGSHQCLQR